MATTPVTSLEETVDTLVRLTHDIHGLTPKDSGRLYLACLALLYHLDVDNAFIQREREQHGDDARFPLLEALPAVTAVWCDRRLFRALLRCLRSGSEPMDGAVDAAPAVGRKRALSIGGEGGSGPSKAPKTSLSPVPASARARATSGAGMPEAAPGPAQLHQQHSPRPVPDAPVAAATALYAALWPLPHWPAPLAAVFAEDCFGPRRWVDADVCGCRLLAWNLALSLQTEAVDDGIGEGLAVDADRLAMAYRDFWDEGRDDWPDADAETPLYPGTERRRASFSSTGSQTVTRVALRNESESDGSSSGDEDNVPLGAPCGLYQGQHQDPSMSQEKRETDEADRRAYLLISEMRIQQNAVCQRFFRSNGCFARELLVKSLSNRLNVKSKQNSGLLTALPSFTTVPEIRELIAENLEKWLQSPALAGLARSLFYAVVKNMKNAGPPLRTDLAVVDSLVKMHLKANQLHTHIENMVELAKSMPHAEVMDRIYSHLFLGIITPANEDDASKTNNLKMIVAVHNALQPEMSYKCLADVMLHILEQRSTSISFETTADSAVDCANLVGRLLVAVKSVSLEIGQSFDGCSLLDAFLSSKVNTPAWSAANGENKARLMFQCLVMHVRCHGSQIFSKDLSGREWQESLLAAKRKLLSWYCTDFLPHVIQDHQCRQKFIDLTDINGALVPIPDYHGVSCRHSSEKVPTWLNTMRCMLMLEGAGSEPMKQFLAPVTSIPLAQDELDWEAIRVCHEISRPVDDEMIWIILRLCASSDGSLAGVAIQMIENLFESCSKGSIHCLLVSDPTLVWELYNIVQYKSLGPTAHPLSAGNVPLLALSNLWWRVTALAIVMCAASSDKIGKILWYESPTIRSAIKMITSNKYCFPTVDCDDVARNDSKKSEKRARDLETNIVERFFLPPIKRKMHVETERLGSRTSIRLLKKKVEASAALENTEKRRRRKLLRALHRAIMVWDPVTAARKPPREAMDLFVCTEKMFNLADIFRHSTHPDFLLLTLGGTDRGAIERAHEWLIPVISNVPSTISRLPSSASCFLLLRSYGTTGGIELKTLSSPLLRHVKSCLLGQLGTNEAVKALRLLLQDLASPESEKRICARRVLQASLTTQDHTKDENEKLSESFLIKILHLDHVTLVIKDCIEFMASATRLEAGQDLVAVMLALDKFVRFASAKSIESPVELADLTLDIITKRAGVFSEAIDLFPRFRSWVLDVITSEFTQQLKNGNGLSGPNTKPEVRMKLCHTSVDRSFTLRLLEGSSIILSVWKDTYSDSSDGDRVIIETLVNNLFESDDSNHSDDPSGLASAVISSTPGNNLLIELWLLLARARSDFIARRAALSVPAEFLPRLIISSGLPRASLMTMCGRLSHLGCASVDFQSKCLKLLKSLTPSESDIGRLGSTRKLQNILAAYFRLHKVTTDIKDKDALATFIGWLYGENHEDHQLKKAYSKKTASKQPPTGVLANISSASSILTDIATADLPRAREFQPQSLSCTSGITRSVGASLVRDGDPFRVPTDIETSFSDTVVLIPFSINGTRCSEIVSFRAIPFSPPPFNSISLWEMLFAVVETDDKTRFLDLLAKKCALCWPAQQKLLCVKWILEHSTQHAIYSLDRMMLFVLYSFAWNDLAAFSTIFYRFKRLQDGEDNWYLKNIADLALENAFLCKDFQETAPWCLEMTILAATSREQAQYIREALRKRSLFVKENGRSQFGCACLYFHLVFPSWIDFELSSLQIADAIPPIDVQVFSSAVEDRLINALCSLKCNVDIYRSGRELLEIACVYPLHLLNKMRTLTDLLNTDAILTRPLQQADMTTKEEGSDGKKEALFEGRVQPVSFHYWGCTYSEGLWLSLADALMRTPSKALFSFGISVGLFDLLRNYLQLLLIHVQLPRDLDRTARLKSKVTDLLRIFEMASPIRWQQWQNSFLEGSEIRKILKDLGITS